MPICDILPEKLKVLCGAGISFNSGIPLANYFLKQAFTEIGFDEAVINDLISRNVPFESWLKLLISYNSYLDNHRHILDMFSADSLQPNTNHFLIARLVKAGIISEVYTVNFDLLLEKAFEHEGMAKNIDYEIIYTDADFNKIGHSNLPQLIKLHGTADDYKSMAITLDKVANDANCSAMSIAITKMMRKNGSEKLLILGYSFSDHFDITPAIEQGSFDHCEIIHVTHDSDNPATMQPLPELWPKKKHNQYYGHNIVMDTDKFIEAVYKYYSIPDISPELSIKPDELFSQYVGPMFKSSVYLSNDRLIKAEIFAKIGDFDESNKILHDAVAQPTIEESMMIKSQISRKAKNLACLGRWDEAISHFKEDIRFRLIELFSYVGCKDGLSLSLLIENDNYTHFVDEYVCIINEKKDFLAEDYVGIEGLWWDNSVGIFGAISGICDCLTEISSSINLDEIITKLLSVLKTYPSLNPNNELLLCLLNAQGINYLKCEKYDKAKIAFETNCSVAHKAGDIERLSGTLPNLLNAYYFLHEYSNIEESISRYITGQYVIIDKAISSIIRTSIIYNDTILLNLCAKIITKSDVQKRLEKQNDNFMLLAKKWLENPQSYHDFLLRYLRDLATPKIATSLRELATIMDQIHDIQIKEKKYEEANRTKEYAALFLSYS